MDPTVAQGDAGHQPYLPYSVGISGCQTLARDVARKWLNPGAGSVGNCKATTGGYRSKDMPILLPTLGGGRLCRGEPARGEARHTRRTIGVSRDNHVLGQGTGQSGHVSGHAPGQVF